MSSINFNKKDFNFSEKIETKNNTVFLKYENLDKKNISIVVNINNNIDLEINAGGLILNTETYEDNLVINSGNWHINIKSNLKSIVLNSINFNENINISENGTFNFANSNGNIYYLKHFIFNINKTIAI